MLIVLVKYKKIVVNCRNLDVARVCIQGLIVRLWLLGTFRFWLSERSRNTPTNQSRGILI